MTVERRAISLTSKQWGFRINRVRNSEFRLLPILTTSLTHFSLTGWQMYFVNLGVNMYIPGRSEHGWLGPLWCCNGQEKQSINSTAQESLHLHNSEYCTSVERFASHRDLAHAVHPSWNNASTNVLTCNGENKATAQTTSYTKWRKETLSPVYTCDFLCDFACKTCPSLPRTGFSPCKTATKPRQVSISWIEECAQLICVSLL